MMNSLYLDTADSRLKIGLVKGETVDFISEVVEFKQYDQFYYRLDELLKKHQLTTSNIDDIYVNRGPGSFMGVRLGVMVAKTLSYLSGCGLWGLDSFSYEDFLISNKWTVDDESKKSTKLLIKPLLKSNFFFTLTQADAKSNEVGRVTKRLSPILKLEITKDVLANLLNQQKEGVQGFTSLKKIISEHVKIEDLVVDDLVIDEIVFCQIKNEFGEIVKNLSNESLSNIRFLDALPHDDNDFKDFLANLNNDNSMNGLARYDAMNLLPLYV